MSDSEQEWFYCNDCGEEAEEDAECCEGGEVVPYDDTPSDVEVKA